MRSACGLSRATVCFTPPAISLPGEPPKPAPGYKLTLLCQISRFLDEKFKILQNLFSEEKIGQVWHTGANLFGGTTAQALTSSRVATVSCWGTWTAVSILIAEFLAGFVSCYIDLLTASDV